jgi:hypothetical protein
VSTSVTVERHRSQNSLILSGTNSATIRSAAIGRVLATPDPPNAATIRSAAIGRVLATPDPPNVATIRSAAIEPHTRLA